MKSIPSKNFSRNKYILINSSINHATRTGNMSEKPFIFTVKTTRNYSYLYIQKAIYKGGKRKVLSYSLGPLSKINEIFTKLMSTVDSLFLGEYLTYCLAEKLKLNQALERKLRQDGATTRQVRLLQCLVSLRAFRPFSKAKLSRFWDHSFLQTLQKVSHVNELYQAMTIVKDPEASFRGWPSMSSAH